MIEEFPLIGLDTPIFLLGMPRSGTTWLSQVFEMSPEVAVRLSPNYSYSLKNRLSPASTVEDWTQTLGLALSSDDPFMTQNWRRERGELEWIKKDPGDICRLAVKDTRFHDTYLRGMELFPRAKCLYIVRHPCGHLNSWKSSPEFPSGADFAANWRTGACRKSDGPGEFWGFNDWKEITLRYLALERTYPDRFKVFKYETLVDNPLGMTENLFRFVGLTLHDNVVLFLSRSHASHDPSVFSIFRSPNVANRWRTEFPEDITAEIHDDLQGTEAERFL